MTQQIQRRSFLAAGAAVVGAFGVGTAQASFVKAPQKWDVSTDILVIGSGGAGLAAAVSAKEAGAKNVLLIEKLSFVGGNTMIASGFYNCVDPVRQKKSNVEDSIEKHFQQTIAGGDYRGDPVLVRQLVEQAYPTLQWLESHGMKFKDTVFQVYGALWPRSHTPLEAKGNGYIRVLKQACDKLGVTIQTDTKLVQFIREEPQGGKLLGVLVDQEGEKKYIRAKAVVLATGGFASNPTLRGLHDQRLVNISTTNNPACSTGEGLIAANEAGAYLVGMDYIQCNPGKPVGKKYRGVLHNEVSRYIMVNKKAVRFINEDARRDVIRDAILAQPDRLAFSVVDDDGLHTQDHIVIETIEKMLKEGEAWKANSFEELGQKMGLDPKVFKKTVEEYNAITKTGKDPMGKAPRNASHAIIKPPFWACYSAISAHHTMGGVRINKDTQVIDLNGKVIPAFYAAGEVTGGIHGTNRLGGNAIADIFVHGRIAGARAAAYAARNA